ncbi:MAG: hypothetical protein K2W97_02705 [Chthoniobacterales bacterium]|nr:hypothetical protein [Chthoniobacterales bacterium]
MKKKPNRLLSRQTCRQQWTLWTFCLVVSLAVFNTSSVLMAAAVKGVSTVSYSSNDSDTFQPRGSFNAVSFEGASNPTASSDHWTTVEKIGAVFGVLTGVVAVCSFAYKYKGCRNGIERVDMRKETYGDDSSASQLRGTKSAGIERTVSDPSEPTEEEAQKKLIAGITPLIKNIDQVNVFLEGAELSQKVKLNLLHYFFSNNKVPDGTFLTLEPTAQQEILQRAEGERNKFGNDQELGLYLADAQALAEMEGTLFSSKRDAAEPVSKSLDSSQSNVGNQKAKQQRTLYLESIHDNITSNKDITISQKLDLLTKLLHPFTEQADRLAIVNFKGKNQEEQQPLLEKSRQSRITIATLLERLPEAQRKASLLNIGVNSDLTYQQKLDLLVAASNEGLEQEKRSLIVKGKTPEEFIAELAHASDCDGSFFDKFLNDAGEKNISSLAKNTLRRKFIEQAGELQSLTYSQRWDLICHYLKEEKEDTRLSILNFLPNDKDKLLLASKQSAKGLLTIYRDKHIQEDMERIVGVPHAGNGNSTAIEVVCYDPGYELDGEGEGEGEDGGDLNLPTGRLWWPFGNKN